jgi:hypothetical protein
MTDRAIGFALAAVILAGCGSEDTIPTAPSTTGGTTNLRGTWAQVGGDTRVWVLDQGGIQGSGTASFSQQSHPSVGAVSGTGGVLGAVILGSFRFTETYEGLTIPSRPSPNYCYIDTEGQLALGGNTMSGSYTETLGCAGVRVSQITRNLVMQRR